MTTGRINQVSILFPTHDDPYKITIGREAPYLDRQVHKGTASPFRGRMFTKLPGDCRRFSRESRTFPGYEQTK